VLTDCGRAACTDMGRGQDRHASKVAEELILAEEQVRAPLLSPKIVPLSSLLLSE
jgi:hypothetical protein